MPASFAVFKLHHPDVPDEASVRAEEYRLTIRREDRFVVTRAVCGKLRQVATVRVHHPDVVVLASLDRASIGREHDLLSVWRPLRVDVVCL